MKEKQNPEWVNKLNVWIEKNLSRVSATQKMLFVHNLHIMIKAGLSIVDGLKILSEQVESKYLRKVITEVKLQVEKGRQLSEVLADYSRIFPPIYVSMIAAGEVSGKLEEALGQVNEQMRKSNQLAATVRGAMIYPAVILIAMTGIAIEMVVFVLPKIIVMFNDFHAELPLPTKILIAIVQTTEKYGLLFALIIIALIILFIWLYKQPKFKRAIHSFFLIFPIIGTVVKKINLASFTMTLSSLLSSAIPIVEAVRITSNVQGNVRYREDLLAVSESLKRGEPLSEILNQSKKRFPPMVVQMIMVGEQTGQVEKMLSELSNYYSNEVDMTMKNFSTIIEPLIILILGLAVAGIAVAVIMPMYSLAQSF